MIGNLFPVKNDWEMFLPEKTIGKPGNVPESTLYIYSGCNFTA